MAIAGRSELLLRRHHSMRSVVKAIQFCRLPTRPRLAIMPSLSGRKNCNDWFRRILLEKSGIEVPRKSRFRPDSVVSTGSCRSKA